MSSFIPFTLVCAGAASAVATVAGSGPEVDHATQARRFVRAFRKSYGERHPRFVESGFRTAVAQVCEGKVWGEVWSGWCEGWGEEQGCDRPQLYVMWVLPFPATGPKTCPPPPSIPAWTQH